MIITSDQPNLVSVMWGLAALETSRMCWVQPDHNHLKVKIMHTFKLLPKPFSLTTFCLLQLCMHSFKIQQTITPFWVSSNAFVKTQDSSTVTLTLLTVHPEAFLFRFSVNSAVYLNQADALMAHSSPGINEKKLFPSLRSQHVAFCFHHGDKKCVQHILGQINPCCVNFNMPLCWEIPHFVLKMFMFGFTLLSIQSDQN